ncbi:hypothetical protein, partial [Nitrosomonas sp.]|uniref:hypothetical protein n=1 Tax=Nitrosomonas sp. TaxID=42353 RepID=UPI00260498B9
GCTCLAATGSVPVCAGHELRIRRKFVLPWIPSKFETGYAPAFSHKTHLSGAFMGADSLSDVVLAGSVGIRLSE